MNNKEKTYKIRYNTASDSDSERWRLIENDNEILVSDIIIDGHTYTTKDWIPEIDGHKWHISCVGHCSVRNNVAYIKTTKEESVVLRHIIKTLTYRFFATITTVITAIFLGASIEVSSLIGLGELLIKPIIYFLHERVWYKFIKIKK